MSTERVSAAVQLYVSGLKSHFRVKTDEELASKLGLSKQAIANWRSRGKIPLKFQAKMLDEYGILYSDWDITYAMPEGDVIYAVSLYVYERIIRDLEHPIGVETRRTIGQAFPQILRLVAARLKGIGAKGSSADTLISLSLAYVDSGQFGELEQLISELREQ